MVHYKMGERLRALRGNRNQAEVAAAIHVSQSALSSYEKEERIPSDEVKMRISRYYGVPLSAIFYGDESTLSGL